MGMKIFMLLTFGTTRLGLILSLMIMIIKLF